MNPGDVITILIFLFVIGSSLVQSLTKKAANAGPQKSDRSLSEIKKYLEEMAQGKTPPSNNPNAPKAKPLYTEPYNAQKKSPPSSQKNVASQRGFEEFLEANRGTAQGRGGDKNAPNSAVLTSSNPVANETNSQKRNRVKEENVSTNNMSPEDRLKQKKKAKAATAQSHFSRFHLPDHLNDVQKAILLAEILATPQKKF